MRLTQETELVLNHILAMGIWLLALQPGVSAQCSELSSDIEISVDWWSVLPYSTRVREKNGNYSYHGEFILFRVCFKDSLHIARFFKS